MNKKKNIYELFPHLLTISKSFGDPMPKLKWHQVDNKLICKQIFNDRNYFFEIEIVEFNETKNWLILKFSKYNLW